jgi:hypothetical protein
MGRITVTKGSKIEKVTAQVKKQLQLSTAMRHVLPFFCLTLLSDKACVFTGSIY